MLKPIAVLTSLIFFLNSSLGWTQGQQNDDLFPNIRDNPTVNQGEGQGQSPITIDENNDEDLPFIPSPGAGDDMGGFFPIITNPGNSGGFGGGRNNRRPTVPGNTNPVNNGEIRVAQVPGQYSCPLFENNSYQDLNLAIANLTNAIQSVSDECRSSQPQVENIKRTNEEIRNSVLQLQEFVSNSSDAYTNSAQLQTNVNTLVTGIDRLADVFKNTTSLSDSCGRKTMSWGRVALELNNVVNSASPFLLLLLASNPALSLTVKTTIMGSVIASNVISAMSQVIASNTVDMDIAEQRNAVLQNTCQYTKVARKIRYIQLAQSGRFQQLEQELEDNIKTYSVQMFGNTSADFGAAMNLRSGVRNNIGAIQANVRVDKEALNELNQRIREAQGNALLVCLEGQQLALTAQDEGSFPNTVTQSILEAYDQQKYLKNIDLSELEMNWGNRRNSQDENDIKLKKKVQLLITSYQKLMMSLTKFESPPKSEELSSCATVTMALTQHIGRMITETSKIMVDDLDKFEDELSQNEDYRRWKAEFEKVTIEKENTNRMARVLKELTNAGAAVYNRSEFNEAANALKRSLLGPRSGLFSGHSPVFAWLEYKNRQFSRALGAFEQSISMIRLKSFKLTQTGRGQYGQSTAQQNERFVRDWDLSRSFKILSKNTLPLNSSQWELACIDLEKAIKDYSEALDHLGTTNFMCDLIYDHLDNSVDTNIIKYCRGVTDYSGVQQPRQRSSLDKAVVALKKKASERSLSYHEMANIVAKKMLEIECRLPRAADSID